MKTVEQIDNARVAYVKPLESSLKQVVDEYFSPASCRPDAQTAHLTAFRLISLLEMLQGRRCAW